MAGDYELDPLTGDPVPKSSKDHHNSSTPSVIATDEEINKIQSLSKYELVDLCLRMARQCGLKACLTQEEAAQAIIDRCMEKALDRSTKEFLPYAKEALDRMRGKAAQSIAMTVEDKGISKLSDDRLLRLEAELARMTGEKALVIPPMPKKLSESQ